MNEAPEITRMLREWSSGNTEVLDELMSLVYSSLRKQAAGFLRRERPGHTLQPTELIHETYLKLAGQHDMDWKNRSQFFAISSSLMRRILVDHARAKKRDKRGGGAVKITLDEAVVAGEPDNDLDLLELDEALKRLATIDERKTRIVELRYFSGLTLEETAAALKISRTTAADDWAFAKAWLHRELTK